MILRIALLLLVFGVVGYAFLRLLLRTDYFKNRTRLKEIAWRVILVVGALLFAVVGLTALVLADHSI